MILKEKEISWYEPKENQQVQDYGFCVCLYISIKISIIYEEKYAHENTHNMQYILYMCMVNCATINYGNIKNARHYM